MSNSGLHKSAFEGELNLVKSRVAGGENPLALDDDNRTPLHWASVGGHADVVDYLLSLPDGTKKLNSKDDTGMTPFLSAVAAGKLAVVKLLLAKGADSQAQTARGQTALHLHKARPELLEVLLPLYTPGFVNGKDLNGSTPLHRCVCGEDDRHRRCVQLLLDAGASLGVQDSAGNTPLHLACEEGYTEMVNLLGPNRGLFKVTNSEGKNPVDVASKPMQKALLEYIDSL
jgi:26S proteasome non-ATPase regulatory subunit 10